MVRHKYKIAYMIFAILWMLVGSIPVLAVSTETEHKLPAYTEAVELVISLGVFSSDSNGIPVPEDVMTGNEFMQSLMRAAGVASADGESLRQMVFGDMAKELSGDVGVRLGQAAELMVRLLGYEVAAQKSVGNEADYISTATSLGLLRGINADFNRTITIGESAKLICNALEIDRMFQVDYGSKPRYEIRKGETLLTAMHLTKMSGIVVANAATSLYDEVSTVTEGYVNIGGHIYRSGTTRAEELLGCQVLYYIENDTTHDVPELLYVAAKNNDIIEVDAKNISQSTTKACVRYWDSDDGKESAVDIPASAILVYNGRRERLLRPEHFRPETGSIRLIDNDGDGTVDVVSIWSYLTYVVKSVSPDKKMIVDQYGQPTLELGTGNKTFKITRYGEEIGLEDVKEWNVLAVAPEKLALGETIQSAEYLNIEVSNDVVSGTITETIHNGIYREIKIDGEAFAVARSFQGSLNTGDAGLFFLNSNGEVAGMCTDQRTNTKYVYLYAAEQKPGLDQRVQLKLFTTENEFVVLECADNIKCIGEALTGLAGDGKHDLLPARTLPSEEVCQKLTVSQSGQVLTKRQLLKIETNGEGKINRIETADMTYLNQKTNVPNAFSKDYSGGLRVYNYNFGPNYVADGNTLVFIVPKENGPTNQDNENDYQSGDRTLIPGDVTYDNISIYDATSAHKIGVVVIQQDGEGGLNVDSIVNNDIAVVDSLSLGLNSAGEESYRLSLICSGKKQSLIVRDDEVSDRYQSDWSIPEKKQIQTLQQGDLIQFTTNAKGELDKFHFIFEGSSVQVRSERFQKAYRGEITADEHISRLYTGYGEVLEKGSEDLFLVDTGFLNNCLVGTANVYLFDITKGRVSISNKTEIAEGDMVFIHEYHYTVKDIIIYRG